MTSRQEFLTLLSRGGHHIEATDMETCYKIFDAKYYGTLTFESDLSRIRTRDHGQNRQGQMASLRSADLDSATLMRKARR